MSISAPTPAGEVDLRTRMLIVEDDVAFRLAAAELLADRGFRVVGFATTAQEAVVECRRLRPDGVLLDVRLPDGHGAKVAGALRALPDPPIVVLTSSDRAAISPEQLKQSGASGFIPKSQLVHSDLQTLFGADPPA